jgi:predicted aldo/keto reductase-like oxidoreductase
MEKYFAEQLRRLRTDHVEYYLMHMLTDVKSWDRMKELGVLAWLEEKKAAGQIKNIGFSYHGNSDMFCQLIDAYDWDFCQIQYNYMDEHSQAGSTGLHYAAAKGIPVVIMEPLLGGRLARPNYALSRELSPLDPNASLAKWALRFCGTYPNVMTILSGMTRTAHIEENIATFSPLVPCSDEELAALERAAVALIKLHTIPCNYCNYCMPCPFGLDIPAILTFRNAVITAEKAPSAREALAMYRSAVPDMLRSAERCTGCNRCKMHCPQSIDIPKELGEIDKWVDSLIDEEVAK